MAIFMDLPPLDHSDSDIDLDSDDDPDSDFDSEDVHYDEDAEELAQQERIFGLQREQLRLRSTLLEQDKCLLYAVT